MSDDREARLAAHRAAVDQLAAHRAEEAREVAVYYRALRAAGLPRLLCWALVRDWHGWRVAAEYGDE